MNNIMLKVYITLIKNRKRKIDNIPIEYRKYVEEYVEFNNWLDCTELKKFINIL